MKLQKIIIFIKYIYKNIYEKMLPWIFTVIIFWVFTRVGIYFEESNIYHIGVQYPKPDTFLSVLFYLSIFFYPGILELILRVIKNYNDKNEIKNYPITNLINYKITSTLGLLGIFVFVISYSGLSGVVYLVFISFLQHIIITHEG